MTGRATPQTSILIETVAAQIKKYYNDILPHKTITDTMAMVLATIAFVEEKKKFKLPDERDPEVTEEFIGVRRDVLIEVASNYIKKNTVKSSITKLKKQGIIKVVTEVEAGKFIDYVLIYTEDAKKIDDFMETITEELEAAQESKYEKQALDTLAELIKKFVAGKVEGGVVRVSIDELQKFAEAAKTRLDVSIIKKIEYETNKENFTRVEISIDDPEPSDIGIIKKKKLGDFVIISGTVIGKTMTSTKRIVKKKFVNFDVVEFNEAFKANREEVIIRDYDWVNDRVVDTEIRVKEGNEVMVYSEAEHDDIEVTVLKLADQAGNTIAVYTYQDTDDINLGDEIIVGGFIDVRTTRNKNREKLDGTIIRGYYIEKTQKRKVELSEERVKEIKDWVGQLEKEGKDPVDEIVERIGFFETMKDFAKAVVYALVSEKSYRKERGGKKVRNWLNVLVISEAGSGKTTVMRTFKDIMNLEEIVDATAATEAGLIAVTENDRDLGTWITKAGVLPRNNGSMGVFIDEFDKAKKSIYDAILSAGEYGFVKITKAGNAGSAKYSAMTSIIAAMNPVGEIDELGHVFEYINIPQPTLDRFDIIIAVRDKIPLEDRLRAIDEFANAISENTDEKEEEFIKFVRDYIHLAAHHKLKSYDVEALEAIKDFLRILERNDDISNGAVVSTVSGRMMQSIMRIAEAIAKTKLHDVVTREDAEEAIRFFVKTRATLLPETDAIDFMKLIEEVSVEELAETFEDIVENEEKAEEKKLFETAKELAEKYVKSMKKKPDENDLVKVIIDELMRNGYKVKLEPVKQAVNIVISTKSESS